jgi:hypothetical protein
MEVERVVALTPAAAKTIANTIISRPTPLRSHHAKQGVKQGGRWQGNGRGERSRAKVEKAKGKQEMRGEHTKPLCTPRS